MARDHYTWAQKGWGWIPRSAWAAEILAEAFSTVKGQLGDLKITSAAFDDPHIKELIELAAEQTNLPPNNIKAKISKQIDQVEQMKKYSYVLYDTCAKKIIRDAAFSVIEDAAKNPKFSKRRVMFDARIFQDLMNKIRFENKGFFPLRRPDRFMMITHLQPIIVPNNSNPAYKIYDAIDTAAATENGHFVFNQNFMQKLMDFAVLEKAKGKGKKYASQGGPIPDAYAFIETLIMHELLHYTYGDHEKMKKFPQYHHKVHNWTMDFRINHLLSKAGFPQIPTMLLSDHINLDQQDSYQDMMKLVHAELEKLPDPLKELLDEILKTDVHPDDNAAGPPGNKPTIQPGSIVRDKANGRYWKVVKIQDGKIDTVPASQEDLERMTGKKEVS